MQMGHSRFADISPYSRCSIDEAPDAPRESAPDGRNPGLAAVRATLEELISRNAEILGGALNFVGLHPIRDRMGARWDHVRDGVHVATRRIIERHLSDRDVYVRYGELDYLVVFPDLDGEAARTKCAEISDEIQRFLIGEDGLAALRPRTLVRKIDGRWILQAISDRTAPRAGAGESPPDGDSPAAADGDPPEDAGDGEAGFGLAVAAGTGATLPAWLERDDADSLSDRIRGLSFVYRPIWDVRREVISAFMCLPERRTGAGDLYGYAVLPSFPNRESDCGMLDLMTLQTALETLNELLRNAFRYLAVVPVHRATLADSMFRDGLVAICRRHPPEVLRYVVFELSGLEGTVLPARVTELATPLVPLCRDVVLQTDLDFNQFAAVADSRIRTTGVDLVRDFRPEKEIVRDLNLYAIRAAQAGVDVFVHGARSRSLTLSAAAAGFSHVDGDAVQFVQNLPQHLFRFEWRDYNLSTPA